jgi:uncharacterized protein (DUF58 family)
MEAEPVLFLSPDFLARLERLRLAAKRLASRGVEGQHPVARRGSSLEFSDYREYQRGDDLRYVDWNAYRRLEKLFLKLFTAEEEAKIYLLIDVSQSMAEHGGAKIAYAKHVAAALGYVGLKNHDRVGAAAISAGVVEYLGLGRGSSQVLSLFKFLQALECGGRTSLLEAARCLSLVFPRPGLVILLSDLLDPDYRLGLAEILLRRHEVLLVHVLDEREMALEGFGEVTAVDAEGSGERAFYLDGDLARRFREEWERYLEEVREYCRSRAIDYFQAGPELPFEDLVLRWLRRGRTVR